MSRVVDNKNEDSKVLWSSHPEFKTTAKVRLLLKSKTLFEPNVFE